MDSGDTFFAGLIIATILVGVVTGLLAIQEAATAEFICETHGLELIDFESGSPTFSKVECGNEKPELKYENYKVFRK